MNKKNTEKTKREKSQKNADGKKENRKTKIQEFGKKLAKNIQSICSAHLRFHLFYFHYHFLIRQMNFLIIKRDIKHFLGVFKEFLIIPLSYKLYLYTNHSDIIYLL